MKIEMLTQVAGSDFYAGIGDIIDRPDAEAVRYINKGYAKAAHGEKIQRAVSKKSQKREVTSRYKVVE